MIAGSVVTSQNKNTPAILTSTGTALAANPARIAWAIQNLGTHPLFVRLGASGSTSIFHQVLKGAVGADDGSGGVMEQEDGAIYNGIITVDGISPRFVVTEIAP